jgi:protein-S-isoprenylcysteine O-methyltransferase Ste14
VSHPTTIALIGYALFLLLGFGFRSWLHWRRTGTTGFVGLSGRIGSAEWTGGFLFVAALLAAGAAPILQAVGVLAPAVDTPALQAAGIALYVAGAAGTLWAQLAMGNAWRIGVDEDARTELVGAGPFRWVRNPIFSAMTVATVGLALVVPNLLSAVAVAALVVALEIHVRLVEEPYLTRVHGDRYLRYAAGTGRFVPGIGRSVRARG